MDERIINIAAEILKITADEAANNSTIYDTIYSTVSDYILVFTLFMVLWLVFLGINLELICK